MKDRGKLHSDNLDQSLTIKSNSSIICDLRSKWEENPFDDVVRFQYASVLSHSKHEEDRRESLQHFEYLLDKQLFIRDCLFAVVTTCYSLGDYDMARLTCEELYRMEPDNVQIRGLHQAVVYKQRIKNEKDRKEREKAVGVAVGAGLIAAVGVGLAVVFSRKK